MKRLNILVDEVRDCRLCEGHLPDGVRPILQVHSKSRILIAGQATGRRVHESGVPFDDPSGDRLREWLGVDRNAFYDPKQFAILPMGFCYPGTGKSGDLPPRNECAKAWREVLLQELNAVKLSIVIGIYAIRWHFPSQVGGLTHIVKGWKAHRPALIPLPHPSPRNNIWLKRNPWFAAELIPYLRRRVSRVLH